jgi:DNA-directed RNA polymerase subunit RPC12/RpoP
MECKNCGYEWETKSEKMFVTCPNCQLKVKRKEVKEKLNILNNCKGGIKNETRN